MIVWEKPDIVVFVAWQWFDRDQVDAIAGVNNTVIAFAVNASRLKRTRRC